MRRDREWERLINTRLRQLLIELKTLSKAQTWISKPGIDTCYVPYPSLVLGM